MTMRDLPRGTVTFLFTDIEGSTKLLRRIGADYADVLAQHRDLLRSAFTSHGGVEVDTQGDALFVAFPSASDAVAAAAEGQRALADGPVRVRMGVHTGDPVLTDEGYVGLDVHKGARIAASAHGGQVVVSSETYTLAGRGDGFIDLGEHRLKDFDEPIQLFQYGDGLFPPLRTISNSNLPRPASRFIGREREIAEIVALIRGGARLVTLSGPGGSGKTRTGIEAAKELIGDFKAGTFWIPLSALRDPRLVLETIGQTIGATTHLADHIGEREMLLLIDNFEQLIDAGPEIADVMEHCPNLSAIVTSRELLRVRGEVDYALPPMVQSEAVRLFCMRAHLEPTDAITELCRRLDDLPLAIELAAARTRVFTPEQIIERLSDRLDLFRGGRDADPRQKTLRTTIEWSHELLAEDEKVLFRDLAVFSGGCDLESAIAVCGAHVDMLQGLVEKSLVRRTADRFWMLETIRELASELLRKAGNDEELRVRHYEHFLERARRANVSGDSEGDQHLELILANKDNFRAAFEYASERGDLDRAGEMAIALELWWSAINPSEGRQRVEPLLRSGIPDDDLLRARLLRMIGGARQMSEESQDAADEAFQESLAIFRKHGDSLGIATLLERLAARATWVGNYSLARTYLEESASVMGSDPRLKPFHLRSYAIVEYRTGNQERGLELMRECAQTAQEMGLVWWELGALIDFAEMALPLGHVDEAAARARRGLEHARQIEDGQGMVFGLGVAAWVARVRGDKERAATLWGAIEAFEVSGTNLGGWVVDGPKYKAAIVDEGDPDFERGRTLGRRLGVDRAIDLALST